MRNPKTAEQILKDTGNQDYARAVLTYCTPEEAQRVFNSELELINELCDMHKFVSMEKRDQTAIVNRFDELRKNNRGKAPVFYCVFYQVIKDGKFINTYVGVQTLEEQIDHVYNIFEGVKEIFETETGDLITEKGNIVLNMEEVESGNFSFVIVKGENLITCILPQLLSPLDKAIIKSADLHTPDYLKDYL